MKREDQKELLKTYLEPEPEADFARRPANVRSCENCGKPRGKEKKALCPSCLEATRLLNSLWKPK